MTHTISRLEEVITRFRHILPTHSAPALPRDRHEPWERLALNAIDGGYFKSANEFVMFVEACLRTLAFEQIMHDRAHAIGVRNLADAIARRWACGSSPGNAPTTEDIAGLLQSDWVVSGQFRSFRSAGS
jgi:hypothetical protein